MIRAAGIEKEILYAGGPNPVLREKKSALGMFWYH